MNAASHPCKPNTSQYTQHSVWYTSPGATAATICARPDAATSTACSSSSSSCGCANNAIQERIACTAVKQHCRLHLAALSNTTAGSKRVPVSVAIATKAAGSWDTISFFVISANCQTPPLPPLVRNGDNISKLRQQNAAPLSLSGHSEQPTTVS